MTEADVVRLVLFVGAVGGAVMCLIGLWRMRSEGDMVIRDDRGTGKREPPQMDGDRFAVFADRKWWTQFGPDRVLHDCPDCGRAHFVTVDGCPGAADAAAEVGMAGDKRAA